MILHTCRRDNISPPKPPGVRLPLCTPDASAFLVVLHSTGFVFVCCGRRAVSTFVISAGACAQLRSIYNSLSQDPNSLSNLDQDLPNYAQVKVSEAEVLGDVDVVLEISYTRHAL